MATGTSVMERAPEALAISKLEAARIAGRESENRGSFDRLEASSRSTPWAARLDSTEWLAKSSQVRSSNKSVLINLAARL